MGYSDIRHYYAEDMVPVLAMVIIFVMISIIALKKCNEAGKNSQLRKTSVIILWIFSFVGFLIASNEYLVSIRPAPVPGGIIPVDPALIFYLIIGIHAFIILGCVWGYDDTRVEQLKTLEEMKANGKVIASDLAKKYQATINRVKMRLLELNRTGYLIDGKLHSFSTSAGSMDYEFTFTKLQLPAYYHAEPTASTPPLASQLENIESPSDTRPGQVTFSPESTEISIPPWRDMAITGLVMTIIALFVCALMFMIAFFTNAIIGLSMTAAQTACIIVGLILVVKLKKLGGIILLANSILMFIPGDPFSMMVVPMLGLFATPSAIAGILFIKALDIKTKALKKQEMNAGEIEKRHSDHFSGWVLSVIAICTSTCIMANFILSWNSSPASLLVVAVILGIGYLPGFIAMMLTGVFVTQKRKTSAAGGVVMLLAGISAWVVVFVTENGSFYGIGFGVLMSSIPAIMSGIITINQRFRRA